MNKRPSVEDRLDIEDLIASVGMLIDCKEAEQLPGLFAPGAEFDYESWGPLIQEPAAKFLPRVIEFIPGYDATLHQYTNFDVAVDGDNATCRSLVTATHRIGEQIWVVGGIYRHKLLRLQGEWKIMLMHFRPAFTTGAQLVDQALARVRAKGLGHVTG